MQAVSREDRLLAALAYPFWYLVFPLIYMTPDKRNDRFLRDHAYQALFLGMGLWVGEITLYTAAALIGKFLVIFGVLLYPLLRLAGLAGVLLTFYCMFIAWQGKLLRLPYLTEFARPFIDEAFPQANEEDE